MYVCVCACMYRPAKTEEASMRRYAADIIKPASSGARWKRRDRYDGSCVCVCVCVYACVCVCIYIKVVVKVVAKLVVKLPG